MRSILLVVFFSLVVIFSNAQESADSSILQMKYEQALEKINAFQFDEALKLLSTCYIEDPQNKEYLMRIAYCNFQLGRYPDAKIFYNEVIKQDSFDTQAISSMGSIYERENNYREALAYYVYWTTIDSTNSFAYKRCGNASLHLGWANESMFFYLEAHKLNESDMEVIDKLSSLYIATEQLDYAEEVLNRGLVIDPNNIRLLQNKARLFNKRKDYPTVVDAIEKTMMQGDTSDYYQMMIGVAYLRLDSLERSIQNLEHIVQREKDTEHTHQYLGLAYRTLGDTQKSIEHFEKAIELGISEKIDLFHSDLAAVYETEGDFRKAIAHYESAYDYNPKAEYLFFLARNNDLAFRDKRMALRYYEQYLNSGHEEFQAYTKQRIKQLKELIHFQSN